MLHRDYQNPVVLEVELRQDEIPRNKEELPKLKIELSEDEYELSYQIFLQLTRHFLI